MKFRYAQKIDLDSIQEKIKTAFFQEENKVVMDLVQELHRETTAPSIKSLVVELDNRVIGYVSYSQILLKTCTSISGYILSPLAMSPKHQKQSVGSNLIKSGIEMLTKNGVDILLVMEVQYTTGCSVLKKGLDVYSSLHTHYNIHLLGQV